MLYSFNILLGGIGVNKILKVSFYGASIYFLIKLGNKIFLLLEKRGIADTSKIRIISNKVLKMIPIALHFIVLVDFFYSK